MKAVNISKNTILAEDIKEAKVLSDKLLGLLKKSNSGGLILNTRFGIHTFFMKEQIDVFVLDNNFRVVELSAVKPNNFFFWNPKHSQILELPKGTIKDTLTQVGDVIIFK